MTETAATIYLVEGPVGAGKSTFAAKLSLKHQAPHLDLNRELRRARLA